VRLFAARTLGAGAAVGALLLAGCASTDAAEPGADGALEAEAADLQASAVRVVIALHAFFEAWFRGELPDDAAAFRRFERALAPGFEIVMPDGEALDRGQILERVRAARDSSGMRISIERPVAHVLDGGEVAVCYEEWHASGGDRSGRASRAVLRPDPGAPGGLAWVRVEETSLD
jgi:hypothetical protein